MSNNGKLTTRDLIGALIELELEKEMAMSKDLAEDVIESIDKSIALCKKDIARKTSSIDYFMVQMNKKSGLIDAEIKTYQDEIKRLRGRKNAIKKTEEYFNKELLPMIIETAGNEGVFETETTRYKMFETWGALEITDEESIEDKYKRYKVEIDKKGARKDVIEMAENGMGISGFKIEKVKRVRRS